MNMKNTKKTLMALIVALSCLILTSCKNSNQAKCPICNTTLTENNISRGVTVCGPNYEYAKMDMCKSCYKDVKKQGMAF